MLHSAVIWKDDYLLLLVVCTVDRHTCHYTRSSNHCLLIWSPNGSNSNRSVWMIDTARQKAFPRAQSDDDAHEKMTASLKRHAFTKATRPLKNINNKNKSLTVKQSFAPVRTRQLQMGGKRRRRSCEFGKTDYLAEETLNRLPGCRCRATCRSPPGQNSMTRQA
jgi:hypothetical protein